METIGSQATHQYLEQSSVHAGVSYGIHGCRIDRVDRDGNEDGGDAVLINGSGETLK